MWQLFGEFLFYINFPIIANYSELEYGKYASVLGVSTFCFSPTISRAKEKRG